MVSDFCKSTLITILLTTILSVNGRPAESNVDNDLGDKNGVQIIEHRATDEDAPFKSLPYYGGAKGKYLLIHPSGRTSITNRNPSFYGIKGEDDDDDEVGMENEDNSEENESTNTTNGCGGGDDGSIAIGTPADNASVAEAKPVGLAIAGVGGVASSKPSGTAVVGPGGLAVSKPMATAIAGIPHAEQFVGLGGGSKKKFDRPLKNIGQSSVSSNKTKDERSFLRRRSRQESNIFEYSNNIPQGYNVFYIPLYLPNEANYKN